MSSRRIEKRGSLLAIAACTLMLLAAAVPMPAGDSGGDAARERVMRLLERDPATTSDDAVVRELVALGAGAVAPAIDVLAGTAPELVADPVRAARVDARKALLWEAFGAWPQSAVTRRAEELARGDVDQVLLAVRILGRSGDARSAQNVLAAVSGLDRLHHGRTRVQIELERSIANLVARDLASAWRMAEVLAETPVELWPAVARGVGGSCRQGGVMLLERMLGQSVDLDQVVLDQLGHVDVRDRQAVHADVAARLAGYLLNENQRLRKQAALSLGRLHDFGTADELIDTLQGDERSVSRGALHALQQVSGMGWSDEQGRWREWYRVESTWLESALPQLRDEVRAANPARVATALRELSRHPALRDETTPFVVAGLSHEDPAVASLACSVAAGLHTDGALVALVDLLERDDEAVRAAAHTALASITGLQGERTPEWWYDWLRD